MFSIASNSGKTAYGTVRLIVDNDSDISALPVHFTPGSTAFVVATSTRYMLNNQEEWVRVASGSSTSSGSDSADAQTASFYCAFTDGKVEEDTVIGVNEADIAGATVADITTLVAYKNNLSDLETVNIEITSSITENDTGCRLIFNDTTSADLAFVNGVATLGATVPTNATKVYLQPYGFTTSDVVLFTLRIQTVAKEPDDEDDIIYDGGEI